jgi:hypothetical protein
LLCNLYISSILGAGTPSLVLDRPKFITLADAFYRPARSTGVAVFVGDWAISQLWLFWVAPIVGGTVGAAIYRFISSERN